MGTSISTQQNATLNTHTHMKAILKLISFLAIVISIGMAITITNLKAVGVTHEQIVAFGWRQITTLIMGWGILIGAFFLAGAGRAVFLRLKRGKGKMRLNVEPPQVPYDEGRAPRARYE